MEPNATQQPCPCCGYCPACGRRNPVPVPMNPLPWYPLPPFVPIAPYTPMPTAPYQPFIVTTPNVRWNDVTTVCQN